MRNLPNLELINMSIDCVNSLSGADKRDSASKRKIEKLEKLVQILYTRKLEPDLQAAFLEIKSILAARDPSKCRCDEHNSAEVVGISSDFLGGDKAPADVHHLYGRKIMKKFKRWSEDREHEKRGERGKKSSVRPPPTFNEYLRKNTTDKEKKLLKKEIVEYLTPAEAEKYKTYFANGKLYPVDDAVEFKSRKYMFVWDQTGKHLFVAKKKKGKFHHTSFVAGDPVKCAGFLTLKNNRIVMLRGHSGHYKPTELHMLQFQKYLSHPDRMGKEANNIFISLYTGKSVDSKDSKKDKKDGKETRDRKESKRTRSRDSTPRKGRSLGKTPIY